MAEPDRGPEVDTSRLYDDDVLEREVQEALGSTDREVELFKTINAMLRVKAELANNESIKIALAGMWSVVADFFDAIAGADTIAGLPHDHELVVLHQRMKANFTVVSNINAVFKDAREAEDELRANDDMDHFVDEEQ